MLTGLAEARFDDRFAALSADASAVAELLTPMTIERFLRHPLVRYPQVRVALDGKGVPSGAYVTHRRIGTQTVEDGIDAERVASFLARGATITVDSLEYLSEPLRRVCDEMTVELGLRVSATAYVTPPGKRGLSPHTDEEDVIVLQTFGSKSWVIDSNQKLDVPVGAGFPLNEGMAAVPPRILVAGDAFFMPAGTPHVASATDELSIHVTLSVERPRVADRLVRAIRTAERSEPALGRLESWRDPLDSTTAAIASLDWNSVLGRDGGRTASPVLPFGAWESLSQDEVLVRRTQPLQSEPIDEKVSLAFPDFTLKVGPDIGSLIVGIPDDSFLRVAIAGNAELKEILFHLAGRSVVSIETLTAA